MQIGIIRQTVIAILVIGTSYGFAMYALKLAAAVYHG